MPELPEIWYYVIIPDDGILKANLRFLLVVQNKNYTECMYIPSSVKRE